MNRIGPLILAIVAAFGILFAILAVATPGWSIAPDGTRIGLFSPCPASGCVFRGYTNLQAIAAVFIISMFALLSGGICCFCLSFKRNDNLNTAAVLSYVVASLLTLIGMIIYTVGIPATVTYSYYFGWVAFTISICLAILSTKL